MPDSRGVEACRHRQAVWSVEVLARPVVGMLVRQDDPHDVVQALQRAREVPRIDHEGLALLLETEAGVFVLRDAHGSSQAPPQRPGQGGRRRFVRRVIVMHT